MKNNVGQTFRKHRVWVVEVLIGVIMLITVFIYGSANDMQRTQKSMYDDVSYIKEQCNNNYKLELASETKSLMRIIVSVEQINRQIQNEETIDKEVLYKYARESYVTGVMVLNAEGNIDIQECLDSVRGEDILEDITISEITSMVDFPEKTYSKRIQCDDGSYIDMAAVGMIDREGVVLAYYHTSEEYASNFNYSLELLLEGYSVEEDGTIVICCGDKIVASNNAGLVGTNAGNIDIISHIMSTSSGKKLVHTQRGLSTSSRKFGLMEKSRDYYIFAYMQERNVFESTPQDLLNAILIYLVLLVAINTLRWRMTQTYQREQIRIQTKYAHDLKYKNEQLKEAVEKADRANLAKTNFLSRMSHDIRTPLNGIIGLLKINSAHSDDEKLVKANREKMLVSANHLLSLINDVLQMSKLEDGEVVLSHEVVSINDIMKDIDTIVEQRAANAGITMEYTADDNMADVPYVYGSPLHIRQLFLNIYSNCIKYNKIGGRVHTRVSCTVSDDGRAAYEWVISDTGIGMSQDFVDHIFEPFTQESVDARSVYNGTGLGMAIVKNLVETMGGHIEVSSTQGVGTTFVIKIPFEIADTAPEVQSESENLKESDIKGLKLLLVEDNGLNAEIAKTLLYDEGAEVTVVGDGKQAVDIFSSNEPGTFDAILMDVMMPVMNGLEATKAIRAMDREDAKTIPIIAMTANAFAEDARKCMAAGMNAHLPKPLQMEKVIATIAKFCNE